MHLLLTFRAPLPETRSSRRVTRYVTRTSSISPIRPDFTYFSVCQGRIAGKTILWQIAGKTSPWSADLPWGCCTIPVGINVLNLTTTNKAPASATHTHTHTHTHISPHMLTHSQAPTQVHTHAHPFWMGAVSGQFRLRAEAWCCPRVWAAMASAHTRSVQCAPVAQAVAAHMTTQSRPHLNPPVARTQSPR